MIGLHRATVTLFCAALALALVNLVMFANRPAANPGENERDVSGWQRWQALEPAQRVACVQRFQAVNRRADARDVWRFAREFGRLTPAEQERLRDVRGVLHETIERQPPARRRDLWNAPARVRAYEAFRTLREEEPGRVEQLRNTWADPP